MNKLNKYQIKVGIVFLRRSSGYFLRHFNLNDCFLEQDMGYLEQEFFISTTP